MITNAEEKRGCDIICAFVIEIVPTCSTITNKEIINFFINISFI